MEKGTSDSKIDLLKWKETLGVVAWYFFFGPDQLKFIYGSLKKLMFLKEGKFFTSNNSLSMISVHKLHFKIDLFF